MHSISLVYPSVHLILIKSVGKGRTGQQSKATLVPVTPYNLLVTLRAAVPTSLFYTFSTPMVFSLFTAQNAEIIIKIHDRNRYDLLL